MARLFAHPVDILPWPPFCIGFIRPLWQVQFRTFADSITRTVVLGRDEQPSRSRLVLKAAFAHVSTDDAARRPRCGFSRSVPTGWPTYGEFRALFQQRRMMKRKLAIALAAVCAVLFAVPTVADAATSSTSVVQRASYNGRSFDMSKGWGHATSCAVISKTEVQCFNSNQAADTYLAKRGLVSQSTNVEPQLAKTASTANGLPACAHGWMCLYADKNGGGRRLIFRDEGWQSLLPYGFQGQTSSVRNNQSPGDLGCLNSIAPPQGPICWSGGGTYASQLGIYDNWAFAVGA